MPSLMLFTINGEYTCPQCMALAGRIFTPETAPTLPIHDNCNCSMTPVWIDEGGDPGGGGGGVDLAEIMNRLDRLEGRMDVIEAGLLAIQTQLRDIVGQAVRGIAGQVAVFDAADSVAGTTAVTWNGVLFIVSGSSVAFRAAGSSIGQLQAFSGSNWVCLDYDGGGRISSNGGIVIQANGGSVRFSHTAPAASDLATLLSALKGMGLVA